MYVQMARVLKVWHLTNSMCRMERRQSMLTPGDKSINASTGALQFGRLHQLAMCCDQKPISRSAIQKTSTKHGMRSLLLEAETSPLLHWQRASVIGPLEDR